MIANIAVIVNAVAVVLSVAAAAAAPFPFLFLAFLFLFYFSFRLEVLLRNRELNEKSIPGRAPGSQFLVILGVVLGSGAARGQPRAPGGAPGSARERPGAPQERLWATPGPI